MKNHVSICISLCLFFLLPFLISCTGSDSEKGRKIPEAAQFQVVYRLKWLYNASVIGDLWARDRGIFSAASLKVDIKEGGPEQDAIKDLELGRAHFGVASADQVIRAASKGAPVVVIAQLFQNNPLQWIYRCSRVRLSSPEDLKRYRIGVTFGGNDEAILMALLAKYKLNPDQMELYAVHYDFNPFWKGTVHLWPVYRNTQGILLRQKMAQKGEEACFLDPAKYGIKFVANSIITSQKVFEQHPELVQRFAKALLKAWAEALADQNLKDAVKVLKKYAPEVPNALLREQIKATRELVLPKDLAMPGRIDVDAWKQTEQIMLDQHLIEHRIGVERLLKGVLP